MDKRKDDFIKGLSLQFDLLEALGQVGELVKELSDVRREIVEIKKDPNRVYLRADAVEVMYGIKRSSLEQYVNEGILNKYKLKGLALFKREEIERNIVKVA